MDNEPEVIRAQMDETRASLTEKVETLENQVVGTAQHAATAVRETVESVKDAVKESMDTVKDSVSGTIEGIKDSLDLSQQFERHPWLMFGGSVAVGYLGGHLLNGSNHAAGSQDFSRRFSQGNGRQRSAKSQPGVPPFAAEAVEGSHQASQPGWLSRLTEVISPELKRLRSLAVGTALGVVRDAIGNKTPHELSEKIRGILDSMTEKLGGEVIASPLVDSTGGATRPEGGAHRYSRHESEAV